MVNNVGSVDISVDTVAVLLSAAVAQTLEQATNVALLNLQVGTGPNLPGVGESLDVVG